MSTPERRHPDDLPGPWRVIGCLIRLVAPEPYREALLGDLIEEYQTEIRPRTGQVRAAWWLGRQALGSVPPLLWLRLEQEVHMITKATVRSLLGTRLSTEAFDARLAFWGCMIGGMALVPLGVVALLRNGSGRAEFVLGTGLAVVLGLLCLLLASLNRRVTTRRVQVPMRRRWAEFAGYLGYTVLLIAGFHAIPAMELSPAGVVLMLLLVFVLGLAVLVLGLLTILWLSPKGPA